MHIPEGILSAPVLGGGAAIATLGIGIGLYTMTDKQMVKVAVLSSTFFVASLIQIPLGPTSVHLVLAGLMGLLLGWAAFPAIAVALTLQATLFGVGGITTLGVNTLVMAVPAITIYYVFGRAVAQRNPKIAFASGCAAGALALLLAALLQATALVSTGREFTVIAAAVIAGHLPVMLIEALITGWCVAFLAKVRPETFHLQPLPNLVAEQSAS